MKVKTIAEALSVLIQGVQIAQSKGVYTLDDAALLKEAIDVIKKLSENPANKPLEENSKKEGVAQTNNELSE